MSEMVQMMSLIGFGVIIAVICALAGAFIMFRGIASMPGEKFLGGVPKGKVFTVPEAGDSPDEPLDDATVLKKTEEFLKKFASST